MGRRRSKKIVIVGDGGCGKTSLFVRKAKKTYSDEYVPTIFENHVTAVALPDKKGIHNITLWDTAGQEDYDRLRPLSYPDADMIFFAFAIDDPQSLDNISSKWLPEIKHFCPDVPFMLVGLKADLREDTRARTSPLVTRDHAASVAEALSAASYVECSARTNKNVAAVFELAVTSLMQRRSLLGRLFKGTLDLLSCRRCRA